MSKTLGQVAEKVYLTEMSSGASPTLAFQAVAEAVVLAVGPQPVIDDLDARMPKAVAERAVIEAAKARDTGLTLSCIEHADNCCHEWCDACQSGLKADSALLDALEALDSEEE